MGILRNSRRLVGECIFCTLARKNNYTAGARTLLSESSVLTTLWGVQNCCDSRPHSLPHRLPNPLHSLRGIEGPSALWASRCVPLCPLSTRWSEVGGPDSEPEGGPTLYPLHRCTCPWRLSPSSEFGPLRPHDHPSQVPGDHDQLRTWDQFIRSPLILIDNGSLPESALRSVLVSSHGPLIPHRAHTIHHQWPRTTERIPTALMRL